MSPAPKRRWFRFSLRTLFVVVTVFGCWLGYELNWLRQRHEFLAKHEAIALKLDGPPTSYRKSPGRAPGMLWLFGEPPAGGMQLMFQNPRAIDQPNADEAAELALAMRLFPEARVTWINIIRVPEHAPGTTE